MPAGLSKFQKSWLDKEIDGILLKEWCSESDKFSAKCNLCSEKFDVSGSGFAQVRSHHKAKKHQSKFISRFKCKSSPFRTFLKKDDPSCGTSSNKPTQEDLVTRAETLWALRVVEGNMSFKSCTETVELFKLMFEDSAIASQMQLKETKVSYVISHGISKYFEEMLIKDIASCETGFAISFDETTNVQLKRQLDVYARYWSPEFNKSSWRYLTSVFLGHATADILHRTLLDVLSSFNIDLCKVICFSMDNPNVNKSFFNKMNETVKDETGRSLSSLGSCNLHVVNNAFKNLLSSLELNFEEFANDMHFFFKHSAVRREDFTNVEEVTEVTTRFLLKHVSCRWLSAGPVAQRLFDQWVNVSEYFLNVLPKQKTFEQSVKNTSRYIRIRQNLKSPVCQIYLAFISFTHKYFENFSLCFQSDEPKIHHLFSEMNFLVKKVIAQFIKDDIVGDKEGSDLQNIDIHEKENWKKLNSIEVGMSAKMLLLNVKESQRKNFLLNIRSALIETVNYLKINLPFDNQILQDLKIFHPLPQDAAVPSTNTDGVFAITRIAKYLHFPNDKIDCIRDEWKVLKYSDIDGRQKLASLSTSRIDFYWRELFSLTDSSGKRKYPNLASLIKTVLILPHGNADPERGFSINKALLNINHSEKTIRSLRLVKDTISKYGTVKDVPITSRLLHFVKDSHKEYQANLLKMKEEEEALKKAKEQKESEIIEKEKMQKRKLELDVKLNDKSVEIGRIKKEKEVAMGIIKEGSERLKKAIEKKNAIEMTVAQALITQGTDQLQTLETELLEHENAKDSLLKKKMKIN